MMIQNIYLIYWGIKNNEERNAAMLITSLSEQEQANKVNEELDESRDNAEKNKTFFQNMNITSNVNDIQQRAT